MTDRLYYHDSFLYDFEAEVHEVQENQRPALILDRTAFYPTSGGQIFDTGVISTEHENLKVTEVADAEDGRIVHYLETPPKFLQPGAKVRGLINATRRRDHMQQHTGQHVLSAAFVRLFNMPTVSFHMADDYCSIDLDTPTLTKDQVEAAEQLANEIILENRVVDIRFVTRDEAGKLGLRKLPPAERDELRLIDIREFDLSACGGTHGREVNIRRRLKSVDLVRHRVILPAQSIRHRQITAHLPRVLRIQLNLVIAVVAVVTGSLRHRLQIMIEWQPVAAEVVASSRAKTAKRMNRRNFR